MNHLELPWSTLGLDTIETVEFEPVLNRPALLAATAFLGFLPVIAVEALAPSPRVEVRDRWDRFMDELAIALALAPNTQPTFLFIGESNSGGVALNSSLPDSDLLPTSTVRILNNDTLASFDNLDIGSNNLRGHTGLASYSDEHHGWEAGLSAHFADLTPYDQAFLVKAGQGGSRVADWADGGDYFTEFQSRVAAADNLLGSPDWRVWFTLGVNDANDGADPVEWRAATEEFIDRIRTELGSDTISIFAPTLMNNTPNKIAINQQLGAIAATDPYFTLVNTTDTAIYPLQDPNHWNAAAMGQMAKDFLILDF